jgi:hypothetical protein
MSALCQKRTLQREHDESYSPECGGGLTLLASSPDTGPDSRFQKQHRRVYGYTICRRAGFQRLPS